MRTLKQICLLTLGLIVFTLLLCCSNVRQEANSDIRGNQNTRISNFNTNQFDVAEFERNRELWIVKNIQSYKMVVSVSDIMVAHPKQVLIEVRNGQKEFIRSLSKDNDYIQVYESYDTVEKIFDEIKKNAHADKLDVLFDKDLGYPTQIFCDKSSDFDDEFKLQVKSLEIIK